MRLDSPILALLAVPLLAWVAWRTVRPMKLLARWLLRSGALLLWVGLAGVQLRCDRPPIIAVMVDVSPSTRGALLRDPAAVTQRLAPLLNHRPAVVHYFADGLCDGPGESAVDSTRLEVPDADAVVLLSDGRFDSPVSLPPVFAVVDPSLDAPGDGRVSSLITGDVARVSVSIAGVKRELTVHGAAPQKIGEMTGDRIISLTPAADMVTATLNASDRWPENDSLAAIAEPKTAQRWAVGVTVPGAVTVDAADLPTTLGGFAGVTSIVLPAVTSLGSGEADLLRHYVEALGGQLILSGSPAEFPATLRAVAPLSATPPSPDGQWVIVIDASGSMGQGGKWHAALDAAARAVESLPKNTAVSLMTFNRQTNVLVDHGSPAAVSGALQGLEAVSPTGPTGLRAALESLKADQSGPTRVLLITDGDADIGDVKALATSLRQSDIQVMALLTSPSSPIKALAEASGGSAIESTQTAAWPDALGRLAARATSQRIAVSGAVAGRGALAGITFHPSQRWQAWLRDAARVLANDGDEPAIAMWNVGIGQILSVATDESGDDLGKILQRSPSAVNDPRFAVTIDPEQHMFRVKAVDDGKPLNGLTLSLQRNGSNSTLDQMAPGTYATQLPTSADPTVAVLLNDGRVVARRAIAGRYPREFDAIGNDIDALRSLAARTGGKLIEPGDNAPLDLPSQRIWRPIEMPATALAIMMLLAGLLLLRMPYLEDRLWHRFARSARR